MTIDLSLSLHIFCSDAAWYIDNQGVRAHEAASSSTTAA